MKRISLVIGFTPYHAYAASRFIPSLDGHIFCAFTKLWPITDRSYIKIGFWTPLPSFCRNIVTFLCLAILVRILIVTRGQFDVYMPHPGHIYSNYLFFKYIKEKKIYLYEDGLLNYYDAVQSNSFVGIFKRVFAYLCGLRYRDYPGHLAGYDAGQYDGAFLSMPDKAVRKDRLGSLCHLDFAANFFIPNDYTVIFLDQDVSGRLTILERKKSVKRMLESFPGKNFTYYYKPHHDFSSELSEIMLSLDSDLQNLPVEMMIERLRPSHVVSFYSSALVNIKNSWPAVKCVSLAASHVTIVREGEVMSLSDLFQEMNVVCL